MTGSRTLQLPKNRITAFLLVMDSRKKKKQAISRETPRYVMCALLPEISLVVPNHREGFCSMNIEFTTP